MPQTIVFDTNYVRSIGCVDFLNGTVPPRLASQLREATKRGDLNLFPATVRTEINAWLKEESLKRHTALHNAARTLQDSGYSVTPGLPSNAIEPDVISILKSATLSCDVLVPTIAEYQESERRTSYRLPPHPKNPDHEEMRDRLIWCQLLNYSRSTPNQIIIATGDQIFKNGATSPEGIQSRISIASTPEELDQRLGEMPTHVQAVIDNLLIFSSQLKAKNISLSADKIDRIDRLRKSRVNESIVEHRFDLVLKEQENPLHCKITTFCDHPVQLMLNEMVFENPNGIDVSKPEIIFKILQERPEPGLSELRQIIGE